MYLVIGLGNYGAKYTMNRHNIGFMCIDVWLKSLGENSSDSSFRQEHKALTKKIKITRSGLEKEILIAKPQTYMNKSGESVVSLLQFYKIERPNLIVVQDDIDQPFGAMKIQFNRGHGGQNGIRNISELFGAADYHRLKLGVGRPEHPGFDIADYVLGNFPKEDLPILQKFLEKGTLALESFIFDGASKAATQFNGIL